MALKLSLQISSKSFPGYLSSYRANETSNFLYAEKSIFRMNHFEYAITQTGYFFGKSIDSQLDPA